MGGGQWAAGGEPERERVIAESLTWLRTPFRHASDVKGAGVDCAMMLVRVFVDTGLVPPLDPRPYDEQWMVHRSEEKFLAIVERLLGETDGPPKPADVIVYKFGRCHAHGAIVLDDTRVIHAFKPQGAVVISPMHDASLACLRNGRPRPRKVYSHWPRSS